MSKKLLFLLIPLLAIGVYLTVQQPGEQAQEPAGVVESQPEEEKEISISTKPKTVLQGDPALILVNGTTSVKSLTLSGKRLNVFEHEGKAAAIAGIDLRGRFGTYPIVVTLNNGQVLRKNLVVTERKIAKAPLGIPEKLGGNTPESEKQLINTLVEEGRIINSIPSRPEKLWSGPFRFPVANPIVTDVYGYSRETGASSISHKGTDFRAPVGTPIYAMNSGLVAYTGFLRNYGNTIVIDHGLGLQTIYMHLSQVSVKQGQTVKKGEVIGKSGDTGYVLGAHLHLSLKIGGISIDPMKFMELFGE